MSGDDFPTDAEPPQTPPNPSALGQPDGAGAAPHPALPARDDPPTVITDAAKSSPETGGDGPAADEFEHYTIQRGADGKLWELGRGAMGVTYKAVDTRLHCDVALKVVRGDVLAKHPNLRERFLREARGAARLRHPNVASVFHLGESTASGECFYAMEFINGETLLARVQRGGPVPAALALEICLQVARALVAAGQQGLVHRDLKPANLMLVADGGGSSSDWTRGDSGSGSGGELLVKVIDFGLVKAVTDAGDLTAFGGFIGTPQFASPEQIHGHADRTGPLDVRSDIYSLGVTLWYTLTGKVPYTGRTLAEIYARQSNQALPLEQLDAVRTPAALRALLVSMLAHDPAERPPGPQALVEALRACRAAATPDSAPAGWTPAAVLISHGRRRRWPLAALTALAAALLLLGSWALWSRVPWFRQAGDGAPSIAVLPFENGSADPENAFFADGVQDDVLNSLSKISELKVISSASVAAYRDPAARANLAKIGQLLGVNHLVQGKVRRAGNQVVISVQLIEAASGRQIWGDRYDRTISNALSLQGEVASEIAGKLRMSLSPEERARVRSRPTENAEAYVLYLRAREMAARAAFKREDYEAVARLYEEAIALDSGFALAHARLSQTRSQIAHLFEPTAALQAAARAAADAAIRLEPALGEAHLALALCAYWADRDPPHALTEFAQASRTLPNDPDIAGYLAAIRRRRGEWAESTADFLRALARSPRNPDLPYELATNYAALGDWPNASQMADRAVALAPDVPVLKLWRADLLFHWNGDHSLLKKALAELPAGGEPDEGTDNLRYQLAMIERDYPAAERILAASPTKVFTLFDYGAPRPKEYLQALIHVARRDPTAAEPLLQAARPVCEAAVREAPADAFRHTQLGLLYAALGWRDAALGESWQAAALLPETKDAADGTTVAWRRAQIYALLGEADGALPLLEHLLKTPSPELLTGHDLRLRPDWDRLRGDGGFQRLVAQSSATPTGRSR